MTVTITDPATLALLASAPPGSEVVGPDGRSFGRLVPVFDELGISREELDRRANAPALEWVTWEEVEAHLRSLRRGERCTRSALGGLVPRR